METRWLDDDELNTWVRLVAMVELLPGALDSQLRRDSALSHFEYLVLAMLSETDDHMLRMTALAARTNATLPRLSHVISRMERRELVERRPCPYDGRVTEVRLTESGLATLVEAAPGHVENVRTLVLDPLSAEQITQLRAITEAVLSRLDPSGAMTAPYRRPAVEPAAPPHA
jgi:DNA-binding MarR family transcriptional regulator